MSFKNKMKNRGISKLDNLVETPDYITPPTPKKVSWNWLKIAIPVTAGLALVIIPVSILGATGAFSAKNTSKSDMAPGGGSYSDPDFNWDPTPGESGSSEGTPASDESYNGDLSFENLLANHHVEGNISIEVYDYADGYMEPTYTFANEQVSSIVSSLNGIESNYDIYVSKVQSVKRNSAGFIMGINHRLIFKDDNSKMVCHYFSQLSTLVIDQSAFDLSGSEAYTLMDSFIEMDYDPTFDETIN